MNKRLEDRKKRTEAVIDYFRGKAGEFHMLKGVLCMGHTMERQDEVRWKYFVDSLRIAERMDEINQVVRDA